MIHKRCKDCGCSKPEGEFRTNCASGPRFRAVCRPCLRARNAVAQAACKARKRLGIAPPPRTNGDTWTENARQPFVPPTDFLPMGEPDRGVALVWRIAA